MSQNENPEIEITDEDVEGHGAGTVRFHPDEEEMFGREDVPGHRNR